MIATEMDKEREIYRRRYVGGGVSAFVLFNSAPGFGKDYVEETLRAYVNRFSPWCEFASVSHVFGEENLAMEVAFNNTSDLGIFVGSLERDGIAFKDSRINHSTFPFVEDDWMRYQGLPWSDARREAYILTQLRWGDPRALAENLVGITDSNYRLRTLPIFGSGSYDALVIVSSEPESFEEDDGNDKEEESKSQVPSPLTIVSRAVERIRTTPGVNDTMVYVCADTLDFYPYNKVVGNSQSK